MGLLAELRRRNGRKLDFVIIGVLVIAVGIQRSGNKVRINVQLIDAALQTAVDLDLLNLDYKKAEAEDIVRQGLELDPLSMVLNSRFARLLERAGKFAEALAMNA